MGKENRGLMSNTTMDAKNIKFVVMNCAAATRAEPQHVFYTRQQKHVLRLPDISCRHTTDTTRKQCMTGGMLCGCLADRLEVSHRRGGWS